MIKQDKNGQFPFLVSDDIIDSDEEYNDDDADCFCE